MVFKKSQAFLIIVFLASYAATPNRMDRITRERIISINAGLVFNVELTGFRYAKWDILAGMEEKLRKLKDKLFDIVKKAKEFRVYNKLVIHVTGHSDADGPFNKKLAASKKRALAVIAYLVRSGLEKKIFRAFWKADTDLKDASKPKSAVNRRVVISFDGLYIPALGPATGDGVVDKIKRLGFVYIKFYKPGSTKELKPDGAGVIKLENKGILRLKGKLISYIPGDRVIIRVRNINTPVTVNHDGTFETDIVIYRGKNYVTSIQQRGGKNIRRSDIVNVVSTIKESVYQFQLKWEGYGDLDLVVHINGKTVNYMVRKLEERGYDAELDIDNRFAGGPENIRIYKTPRNAVIKVYIDYYANIPWKKRKWYFIKANFGPLKYTLYVFSKRGKLLKTIKGEFNTRDASMEIEDMRLVGTFVAN